jgi:hypothetical protein
MPTVQANQEQSWAESPGGFVPESGRKLHTPGILAEKRPPELFGGAFSSRDAKSSIEPVVPDTLECGSGNAECGKIEKLNA